MKFTVKEKVKLSFDITANIQSIRYVFLLIFNELWAKHTTCGCQTKNICQKVTVLCFYVVGFETVHSMAWRRFNFKWERIPQARGLFLPRKKLNARDFLKSGIERLDCDTKCREQIH